MTEYKVPIYYSAGDRLQLFTYTSISLTNDIIYTVINNILYKGLITDAKLTDIDQILNTNYILYFKQHIANTRVVYSNDTYYLEHLIRNSIDSVIDVQLNPICCIKDSDIRFIIDKLNIKV